MLRKMIFLHGLLSSSLAYKASVIRKTFPELIVPDFIGPLEERMESLYPIFGDEKGWTIIGCSQGGLMGAKFTCDHPDQVKNMVLLAPALMLPQFASYLECEPVSVPTTIIHGTQDRIVPLETVREFALKVFSSLSYEIVDDDHSLHKTANRLNWKTIIS